MLNIHSSRHHKFKQASSPKQQTHIALPIQQPHGRGQSNPFNLSQRLQNGGNGETKVVAPLIYKMSMRLVTLDRNATETVLRVNLCNLTQYAIEENGNIDSIYTWIKIMLSSKHEDNQWMMSSPYFLSFTFMEVQTPHSIIIRGDCKLDGQNKWYERWNMWIHHGKS